MKLRQGDWKSYDEESRGLFSLVVCPSLIFSDFLDLVHTVRPDAMLLRLDSGRHETGTLVTR